GKVVLDLGCGSGRFIPGLAAASKKYFALDISGELLALARKKAKCLGNVELILSSAESIKLPSESVDIVISTWVISTLRDVEKKSRAISEAERVLKKGGEIWLVENDSRGEFEDIRMPSTTKPNIEWLEKEQGFSIARKMDIHFRFASLKEAREIFQAIWGKKIASRVKSRTIRHKVIIFRKKKV
ncbi:MAG: class I SAM-dependent methyltransferase, partial [Candidatus Aenigmarchaeota archaeon]|nr:class I SAM-dependent methyltransferase [Candidatus Aenigmarchaeota archaeon]